MSRFSAILWGRCPHCLHGEVFSGPLTMRQACPVCQVQFERESGYFLTAIFFGYILAFVLLAPILLYLYFTGASPQTFLAVGIGVLVLASPLIFRYARLLWMHLDELLDPR